MNEPVSLQLEGKLDEKSLARAIAEIVRRQESLRTVFFADASFEHGAQQVTEVPEQVLEVIDLQALPSSERKAEAERLKRAMMTKEFDLQKKGPFFAQLLRLGPSSHVLSLTAHQMVIDGTSWLIFRQELETLYNAYADGKPSPLPEQRVQARDFAELLYRNTAWLLPQLAYWRKKTANASALRLPLDRPRLGRKSMRLITIKNQIPTEIVAVLDRLCREWAVTLPTFLLATFNLFLSGWCDQKQLLLWTVDANRPYRELNKLIGNFLTFLPFVMDLSTTNTFAELLRRVQETTAESRANSAVPATLFLKDPILSRLVEAPIVVFNYLLPQPKMELRDLSAAMEQHPEPLATHDLRFLYERHAEGLFHRISASADTFDQQTIESLAKSYREFLQKLVSGPLDQFQIG